MRSLRDYKGDYDCQWQQTNVSGIEHGKFNVMGVAYTGQSGQLND